MIGQLFASLLIVLMACASVAYFLAGDVRHGVYWLAAAVLNIAVTV